MLDNDLVFAVGIVRPQICWLIQILSCAVCRSGRLRSTICGFRHDRCPGYRSSSAQSSFSIPMLRHGGSFGIYLSFRRRE
jgi:hypothetical protein